MAAALAKDYVDLKIDTDRMKEGREVARKLRGSARGGIPWMVIVDAKGEPLITSDGPKGNVGCPVTPAERRWFLEMIRNTRKRMDDEDIALVDRELTAFAEKILARRGR